MIRTVVFYVVVASLLFLSGCAHVLSKEALVAVDPMLKFAQVKADPDASKGKTMLLGGLIVDHSVNREGTTLEILRYTLDRWGNPDQVDETGGRFLVCTERFLDATLYGPGLFITLTGIVMGHETRPLGKIEYDYPVFQMVEAYIWTPPPPRFVCPYPGSCDPYFFGRPFYYEPFLYGFDSFWYPYDPFWYHYGTYRHLPSGRRIK
jgi:outer membrane lipoprotein